MNCFFEKKGTLLCAVNKLSFKLNCVWCNWLLGNWLEHAGYHEKSWHAWTIHGDLNQLPNPKEELMGKGQVYRSLSVVLKNQENWTGQRTCAKWLVLCSHFLLCKILHCCGIFEKKTCCKFNNCFGKRNPQILKKIIKDQQISIHSSSG